MADASYDPMERLEDQLRWYDGKSATNKAWFHRLKATTIIAAALIPLVSGIGVHAGVAGGLGVLVVIVEGFLGLKRYQENWVEYRSTAEALRHHKHLFLAGAGPYKPLDADQARRHLAEAVETLVSTQHAKWEQSNAPQTEGSKP